ncbi:hypothetical protein LR004_02945, partial [Candidatus Gracilibacteria bacterium]|nr:hypothetical protein [Candidatus Gracilibacteria bacterium]
MTSIEKDISSLESQEQSEERDSKIELLKESKIATQKSIHKLNKALNIEKSPLKRKAYQDEALMRQFANLKLKEVSKKGKSTEKNEIDITEEIKKTFKGRVSKTSIAKVVKEFEVNNIIQTIQAEIKEKQLAKEKNKETSQEHIPEEYRGEQIPESENPFAAETETLIENTQKVFEEVAQMEDEGNDMDSLLNSTVDEMLSFPENSKEKEVVKSIGNFMKEFSDAVEKKTGRKPSFDEYLNSIAGEQRVEDQLKMINLFASAWYTAGLGKVNAEKEYQAALDMQKDLIRLMEERKTIEVSPEEKEIALQEQRQEEKKLGLMESENEVVKRDINGIPIIEETREELYKEEHKVHYSVLEYENIESKDGDE